MHDMLDFRYFYYRNGRGYTTCDFARQATANSLRSVYDLAEFLTPKWFDSLPSGSNPVVLGFLIEEMLLSWISVYGFLGAHSTFKSKPDVVQLFHDDLPQVSAVPGFTLYIPSKYNNPAVDAIMVPIDKARAQAVVAGVQTSLSDRHANTEEVFLRNWKWWEQMLLCDKVTFVFVWLLEKVGSGPPEASLPEPGPSRPRRSQRVSQKAPLKVAATPNRPEFHRVFITIKDVSAEIGENLRLARLSSSRK